MRIVKAFLLAGMSALVAVSAVAGATDRRAAEKAAKKAAKAEKAERLAAERAARNKPLVRTSSAAKPSAKPAAKPTAKPAATRTAVGKKPSGRSVTANLAAKKPVFERAVSVTNANGRYIAPPSLRRPYVAVNWTKAIVEPGEKLKVPVFVTDYDNSLARLGDDSHRFSVTVRLRRKGDKTAEWQTIQPETLQGVKAGDYETELPTLAEGEWQFGVHCVDDKGRRSHTVWHEVWCREPKIHAEEIAKATKRVTPEEIVAKGGVSEKEGLYRIVGLNIEADSEFALTAKESGEPPAGGYLVFAKTDSEGRFVRGAFKSCLVVRSPARDEAAVEAQAEKTGAAIQAILDEAAAAGVRKVVLPKGIYRISHKTTIRVPTRMTLDLNGSTLKLNTFTGCSSQMVCLEQTFDAHLENGVLEGDYFEHDYANSEKNSEWVDGGGFKGACRYSTIRNIVFRNITGYGGECDANHVFPKHSQRIGKAGKTWENAALNLETGETEEGELSQFTTDFRDISNYTEGYISFSRYLGYQGKGNCEWTLLAAFYDAEKKFLGGDVCYQYRVTPIPSGAKYVRVTLEAPRLEGDGGAKDCDMTAPFFRTPWNCAFVSNRFERCRCVGLATAAMHNMLIEGNTFTQSGESLAKCAFDAEDGWDMMQDVFLKGNRFYGNFQNDIVVCGGHDFLFEGNEGDIYLWGRLQSPLVRGNRFKNATYRTDTRNRTMHGRYYGNRYSGSVSVGVGDTSGWTVAVSEIEKEIEGPHVKVNIGANGLLAGSTLTGGDVSPGNYRDCVFANTRHWQRGGRYDNCRFTNAVFNPTQQTNLFLNCALTGCRFTSLHAGGALVTLSRSALTNTCFDVGYWSKPSTLVVEDCTVANTDCALFRTPVYSIGDYTVRNTVFTGTRPVVEIYDFRAQPTDELTGRLVFDGLTQLTTGASPLVDMGKGEPKTKTVEIAARGLKLAPGVTVVAKEKKDCPRLRLTLGK